ncbi:plasmid SOS inhibition protein A (plasmid) [Escherichia coli PMV-1]|nr:plasmid SOS inhibition protein A [Escherichia coli PMV-1]
MQQNACSRRCGFGQERSPNPRWMQKYSRQQAREAEQKARAYQVLVAQAEIELAFHSPEKSKLAAPGVTGGRA